MRDELRVNLVIARRRREEYFEGGEPPKAAAIDGFRVTTYDNHMQAAFRVLRASFKGLVDLADGIDLPPWYEVVENMSERYAVRQVRRASNKKEKQSNIEGKRGNSEGEGGNSEGEGDKSAGRR